MTKKNKVVIIGAGIAGLAAGSYLERNGYDTEIFEAHSQPGGVCTAWRRGDYTFDYCIHWLMGTKPGTDFYTLWEELGALKDEEGNSVEIRNFEEFSRIEVSGGEKLVLYSDLDKFKEELLRVGPEDKRKINRFIADLEKLANFSVPVTTENWGWRNKLGNAGRNLPSYLKVFKYLRMPLGRFARQWQSSQLQEAFSCVIPEEWSTLSLLLGLAKQHTQEAGYPVGGSLPFARNIERKYLELGGEVHYNSRVEKIIVDESKKMVNGIRLTDGTVVEAEEVVSAADGYTTLYQLLENKFYSKKTKQAYEEFSLFPSSVFLGFGVNKELNDLPHALTIRLSEPLALVDGSKHRYLNLNIYNFDPTLAPENKTVITVLLNTWQGEFWSQLAGENRERYKREKEKIRDRIIKIIGKRIPDFEDSLEITDVSTPHSVKRYTGNWQGSYEGFAATPKALMTKLPKEVPGLENCHMIGQWTEPGGGIPAAALDGRNLARKLCEREGRKFIGKQ